MIDAAVTPIDPNVESINLYPNPANEDINVVLNVIQDKEVAIVAYDETGKLMINENRTLSSGTNTLTYDVTNWNNGIYFIRITNDNQVKTVKVMINR